MEVDGSSPATVVEGDVVGEIEDEGRWSFLRIEGIKVSGYRFPWRWCLPLYYPSAVYVFQLGLNEYPWSKRRVLTRDLTAKSEMF